jgi:hypothetical protein
MTNGLIPPRGRDRQRVAFAQAFAAADQESDPDRAVDLTIGQEPASRNDVCNLVGFVDNDVLDFRRFGLHQFWESLVVSSCFEKTDAR